MPTFRDDLRLGRKVPLIEGADLMNGSIGSDKIAEGAVSESKLKDGAVGGDKIAAGAVSGAKIAAGSITGDKFSEDFQVTDAMIKEGTLYQLQQKDAAWSAAEGARAAAESARNGAESARVSAESARSAAESARNGAESARVSAESARVVAEQARVAQASGDHLRAESDHVVALGDHEVSAGQQAVFEASEADRQSVFEENEVARQSAASGQRSAEAGVAAAQRASEASVFSAQIAEQASVFEEKEAERDAAVEVASECAERVLTVEGKVANVDAEECEVETEAISVQKDDGTEVVGVSAEGVCVTGSLKKNGAEVLTEHQSLTEYAKKTEIPTKTSQLTNDSNYISQHQDISGKADKTYVDSRMSKIGNIETSVEDDAVVFCSDDGEDEFAAIDRNGIYAKSFFDINGVGLETRRVFEVRKSGGKSYTSLTKAIKDAVEYFGSVVYVDSGEYDLIEEFEELYGEDYFSGMGKGNLTEGILLKNRVTVIFAEDTKVLFDYDGSNEYVCTRFSPFNAGEYGFELIGAKVYAIRCRYCVHDDRSTRTDPYINVYRNCYFYHDITGQSYWKSKQCIGGGLGVRGLIRIEDCVFDCPEYGVVSNLLTYHNSASVDAQSRIFIKGCVFPYQSTIRISWYGGSEKISKAYISGNVLGAGIIYQAEKAELYNIKNIEYVEWNNKIITNS